MLSFVAGRPNATVLGQQIPEKKEDASLENNFPAQFIEDCVAGLGPKWSLPAVVAGGQHIIERTLPRAG